MCDPTGGVLTVALIGAAVSAYGVHQAGKDADRIERANAKNADIAAQDAIRRGNNEEEEHRRRVRAMLGAQRSRLSANNVDTSSGSPLGLLVDTISFGELDALTIRNNAAREAWGYQSEGAISRMQGRAARRSGNWQAAGTLLAGGAQAYGSWKDSRPAKKGK